MIFKDTEEIEATLEKFTMARQEIEEICNDNLDGRLF